jgi:hypothetical protein
MLVIKSYELPGDTPCEYPVVENATRTSAGFGQKQQHQFLFDQF